MSALTAVVRSNRRATPTTRLVTLAPRGPRFEFHAGQWANLGLTVQTAKPYSIASPPRQEMLEFLIREDGSGVDLAAARRGAAVHVEGPHGRFTLTEDAHKARDVLFIAGGTGIAPIRSMLAETLRHRPCPRCALVYSARNSHEFAFLPELRTHARQERIALSLVVTRHAPSRWKGLSGRLTGAILDTLVRNANPLTFVCGPEGFVRDVTSALKELGVERIRVEEQ